ncbi:hypothetical protein Q9966_010934 [Columba livia]|nr:hypothetical protein Q9966_010934 [Columba livia]
MQVCLQGSLRKTPALVAGQLFSLLPWDPRKRSRSSLAVRSVIAQIDGSKEQEKLKEKCFLAVSLREMPHEVMQKAISAVRKTTEGLGMENRKNLQFGKLSQTPLEHMIAFIEEVRLLVAEDITLTCLLGLQLHKVLREIRQECTAMEFSYEEHHRNGAPLLKTDGQLLQTLDHNQKWWVSDVEMAFGKLEEGLASALRDCHKKQKIMTICTIDVHARDRVASFVAQKVTSSPAFAWVSQLRHRWDDGQKHCFANICNTQFQCFYEYSGNTPWLVITPLTDRPCAMAVPDIELICEMMLIAEQFIATRLLAKKLINLYILCRELLPKQDHYSWGPHAIEYILVAAGSLKQGDKNRSKDQHCSMSSTFQLVLSVLELYAIGTRSLQCTYFPEKSCQYETLIKQYESVQAAHVG